MAANEAIVAYNGVLRWVEASGTNGTGWSTGTTPTSGILGFFSKFSYQSAVKIVTVMNRGNPHHDKRVAVDPISIKFDLTHTGGNPPRPTNAWGRSVPAYHLEAAWETPHLATSFEAMRFFSVPFESLDYKEGDEGNTWSISTHALAMERGTALLLSGGTV